MDRAGDLTGVVAACAEGEKAGPEHGEIFDASGELVPDKRRICSNSSPRASLGTFDQRELYLLSIGHTQLRLAARAASQALTLHASSIVTFKLLL
jgi:hypothetical protein